jgi:hypothetical protein
MATPRATPEQDALSSFLVLRVAVIEVLQFSALLLFPDRELTYTF